LTKEFFFFFFNALTFELRIYWCGVGQSTWKRPEVVVCFVCLLCYFFTVEMLADEFAAGRTIEQLLYSYHHLTRKQIEAALAYAADMKQTSLRTD
jgi:hypothetical protein